MCTVSSVVCLYRGGVGGQIGQYLMGLAERAKGGGYPTRCVHLLNTLVVGKAMRGGVGWGPDSCLSAEWARG